jgi:hypothetical protein
MAGVWLACVVYTGSRINWDWTPHDEGLLAQGAERMLAGQLPHRDFGDAYTGLLTAYHAMAFAVGGHSLLTLRIALLVAFALWVPVFYAVATRFLSPLGAALATATAVVWSVPNYSASMPTWYNLFLTTAGTLAVIRYLETSARRWLTVAGVLAGLSVLMKIVGIYFIVAIGVYLYWRSLYTSDRPPAEIPYSARWCSVRAWFAVAVAILLSLGLLGLVWHGITSAAVLHFVIPGVAVSIVVAAAGLQSGEVRWRTLALDLVAFAVGVASPIVIFIAPYIATHAIRSLITGVFVSPLRRLALATRPPPGITEAARAIPVAVCVWMTSLIGGTARRTLIVIAIPVGVAGLVLSVHGSLYVDIIDAARAAVPIAACAAAALLLRGRYSPCEFIDRERAVLVVFVGAFFSLVQFPYAVVVYFCYVAPLALLAVVAVTGGLGRRPQNGVGAALLAFTMCFAIWRMNTRAYDMLGSLWFAPKPTALLPLPRGGLRISPEDSAVYTDIVPALRDHATGDYMFCTPDCPETYFLAGLRNPTRTFYEFLDDPPGGAQYALRSIVEHQVSVVAVNRQPRFSPLDTELVSALGRNFPDSIRVGYFTVRWR